MSTLRITPNDTSKNQLVQNQQIYVALNAISAWSYSSENSINSDYTEPVQPTDESTTSATYVNLANFTKNFNSNGAKAQITFDLTLRGQGVIAIVLNGAITDQIPFNQTNFNQLLYSRIKQVIAGTNNISVQWKAITGTITKANTDTNLGYNFIQISGKN